MYEKNTPDKSNCRCKGTIILRYTQIFAEILPTLVC